MSIPDVSIKSKSEERSFQTVVSEVMEGSGERICPRKQNWGSQVDYLRTEALLP